MSVEEDIKSAEATVDRISETLSAARKDLMELYVRRSKENYGIEAGMRVRSGRWGKEGIVERVNPESYGSSKPWVYVKTFKKDGKLSALEVCFYSDWEICAEQ